MTSKTIYQAPDIELEKMSVSAIICDSGETEDYELISDFEW